MGTVKQRTDEVNRLITEVKNSPMCLHFQEDKYYYLVQYPDGFYPNGVRCEKSIA